MKLNRRYSNTGRKLNESIRSSRPFTTASLQKLSNSKDKFPSIYNNRLQKSYNLSKKFSVQHPHWEKEQLLDRCIKLQTQLNDLNEQYKLLKKENLTQKKKIKEQNDELNKYNNIQLEEEKNDTNEDKNLEEKNEMKKEKKEKEENEEYEEYEDKESEENEENKEDENIKKNENNKQTPNKSFYEKIGILTEKDLEEITNKENLKEEKEKEEKMRLISEALISNLKMRCKELVKENQEKEEELKNVKNKMKSSKISELERERDIYAEEMNIIKKKLEEALNKVDFYEKREEEIDKLNNKNKKKDKKIQDLSKKNYDNVQKNEKKIMELEKELENKDKEIMILERDLLKKTLKEQLEHQREERNKLVKENDKKLIKYKALKKEDEMIKQNIENIKINSRINPHGIIQKNKEKE